MRFPSADHLRQAAKMSMVFLTTTATYMLARMTGVLPSWHMEKALVATERADGEVSLVPMDLSSSIVSTAPTEILTDFTEIHLDTFSLESHQRHLLQQPSVMIVDPLPDQIVEVGQSYSCSLSTVFSPEYSLLSATETGKNNLPDWLSLEYQSLGVYLPAGGNVVKAVVVVNHTAFLAHQTDLLILDISRVSQPVLLSNYPMPQPGGQAVNLVITGDIAFIAASNVLLILNVSVPDVPQLLGSYPAEPGAMIIDVDVAGDLALVASRYGSGLLILNITNSSAPFLLATYPAMNNSYINSVSLRDQTAFVTDWNTGLLMLDVNVPGNPELLSIYNVVRAQSVTVVENRAFLMQFATGLHILDIGNITHPVLLSFYASPSGSTAFSVTVSDDVAFLADGTNGLQVLNVSDPASPKLLGDYPAGVGGTIYGAAIAGNIVYISAGSFGLQIIDLMAGSLIGVPPVTAVGQRITLIVSAGNGSEIIGTDMFILTLDQFPRLIQSTLLDQSLLPGESLSLLLDSEILFTNPSASFLKLSSQLSNAQPTPVWQEIMMIPTFLSSIQSVLGTAYDVVADNGMIFVGTSAGLGILDISSLTNPRWRGSYLLGHSVAGSSRLTVFNNIVFMALGSAGLLLINVSAIDQPVLLSNFTGVSTSYMTDSALFDNGTKIVITDKNIGLWTVDISDLHHPALLGNYTLSTGGSGIQGVATSGNRAFIGGGNAGLLVFDISNPSLPVLLSSTEYPTTYVEVSGTQVFVISSNDRLQIFSRNDQPGLLGQSTSFPSAVGGLTVTGTLAWVADGTGGLRIVDAGDPSNPKPAGAYPVVSGMTYASAVVGNIAVISTAYDLQILDVSQWRLTANPGVIDVGNYPIQVIATDVLGGSASSSFMLRVEGSPQIHGAIPLQYAKVGRLFNYFIPQGLVTDPNFDFITFRALLSDGQQLPNWLRFNSFSAAFAGVPQGDDTGNFTIVVSATDNIVGIVNITFGLLVVYTPSINQPIADQVADVDVYYQWMVPQNTFLNPNGGQLTYAARWNGQPLLPAWLNFNDTSRQFYGNPGIGDKNAYSLSVTARDNYDGQVSAEFTLIVENFPRVNQSIPAEVAGVNLPFTFTTPLDAFSADDLLSLTYSVRQTDGASLPNWLSFNPSIRLFSGVPLATDAGILTLCLTATDIYGASAQQNFNLTIKSFPQLGTPLPTQVAGVDHFYSFMIPNTAFINPIQEPLWYRVQCSDGSSLPNWLNFNSTSLELFGIANSNTTPVYALQVIADDGQGAQVNAPLSLFVDYFPYVNKTLPALIAQVGKAFNFVIPADTFADPDDPVLIYQATQRDGSRLPSWLTFAAQTQFFSGVAQITDLGVLPLKLTVTDRLGVQAEQSFNLTVKSFPQVTTPIPDQVVEVNSVFAFIISEDTFTDLDDGILLYSAALSGGLPLPGWIDFDNQTLQFSGTPGEGERGHYDLALTCLEADMPDAQAIAEFSLLVEYFPLLNQPVPPQIAGIGQPFRLALPANTFMDLDNEPLTYRALLTDASALPRWLSFNPQTLIFSGVSQSTDAGVLTLQLTAADPAGGKASCEFNLTVVYQPQSGTPIAAQLVDVGTEFRFIPAADTFINPGNAVLVYSAQQAGDLPLPNWLGFNASLLQFLGIPTGADIGYYSLQITATDERNASAIAPFIVEVENFPRAYRSIMPLLAGINFPYTFALPSDTFLDEDGDLLTYQARRSDGSVLPNWLSFNPQSLVFSGVPSETDFATLSLQLAARDPSGGEATTNFTLNVVHFPVVATPIPPPPALREDRSFSFQIPSDTFSDPDAVQLLYNATMTSSQPLPSWLHFNTETLVFSGTPALKDVGTLNALVIAQDDRGLQAQAPVSFVIVANMPPVVSRLLSDQTATVGEMFNFYVPTDIFLDPNGDNLTYTTQQSGGEALPHWLHFNAESVRFWGKPGRGDTNTYAVRSLDILLTASDDRNAASTSFKINVQGTSYLALTINIGLPLFSFLTTLYTIYRKRALCLNRCHKQRYQKLEQIYRIGGEFIYHLETPPEKVFLVQAKLPGPEQGCCRFFKVDRHHLPGGAKLPTWLTYDTHSNTLHSTGVIPARAPRELIFQVKDDSGLIQEQFTVKIKPSSRLSLSAIPEDPVIPELVGADEHQVELRGRTLSS